MHFFGEERTFSMHAVIISNHNWERFLADQEELEPIFVREVSEAQTFLEHAQDVRCVVIDVEMKGFRPFLAWLRGHPQWLSMPVIAVVDDHQGPSFIKALSAGADDVVARNERGELIERIVAVSRYTVTRPKANKGRALVAHSDARVRRLLGRYLRHAGFDLSFAAGEQDLAERAQDCRIVVASVDSVDDPARAMVRLRKRAGADMPVVWVASDQETPLVRSLFAGDARTSVNAIHAPGDNLWFRVNELMAGAAINARESRRLLVSMICAYRFAKTRTSNYGLTYNISRAGLYIRTLAPIERGEEVWIELCPFDDDSWIHLRAKVVWRRRSCDSAATPPGFGVQIIEEECPVRDLRTWREAYAYFLEKEEQQERVLTQTQDLMLPVLEMGAA